MFCYVILHYLTADDTIQCVDSILNKNEKCKIIIVDNASGNGSIEKVSEEFGCNNDIIILKNNKNLGFASGNNVGYKYAKEHFSPDFIAVLNNDILVETEGFVGKVREAYNKCPFHIAGPDIISMVDQLHQNPMKDDLVPDKKSINKEILHYKMLYIASKLGIYDLLKKYKTDKVQSAVLLDSSTKKSDIDEVVNCEEDVQLHGSFMIFSSDYIVEEDFAFRPGTFLYMEESILHQYCLNNNYVMRYLNNIIVYHKEDSSTNALCGANKRKREFVFYNMIRSLKVYRKVSDLNGK